LAFLPDLPAVPRLRIVEIARPADRPDDAILGRPVAMAFDGARLLVADALDCAVKIFSQDGRYLGSFGGKGQGPGELSFPSGVCVDGDVIAVADKLNLRIQLFDRQGRSRGGFVLPFTPDRVFALSAGRVLVTSTPTGRRSVESLLHIYGPAGRPIWDGLEARRSSDAVTDAFLNMILVCPGQADDFYVLFRSGDRRIFHYSASGSLRSPMAVDERLASTPVVMPVGRGGIRLSGFCWAAAFDRGLLYLSPPRLLAGKDLGPGRSVAILDANGRMRAEIDLPCAVHRFLVAAGRVFAIDEDEELRIFEVAR
jgi:hypothetical protein